MYPVGIFPTLTLTDSARQSIMENSLHPIFNLQRIDFQFFLAAKILAPLGPTIRQFVILFDSLLEKAKKF